MFSLKLSYLPSSDERLQSRDERSSAHPCSLSPSTDTFQAQTEYRLFNEHKHQHTRARAHTHLWQKEQLPGYYCYCVCPRAKYDTFVIKGGVLDFRSYCTV